MPVVEKQRGADAGKLIVRGNGGGPLDNPAAIMEELPDNHRDMCEWVRRCEFRQLDRAWVAVAVDMIQNGDPVKCVAEFLDAVRECFRASLDDVLTDEGKQRLNVERELSRIRLQEDAEMRKRDEKTMQAVRNMDPVQMIEHLRQRVTSMTEQEAHGNGDDAETA